MRNRRIWKNPYRLNPDASIRALERAYQGDPDDLNNAIALITSRLRQGILDPYFVEVAAMLNHPVARAIFPNILPTTSWSNGDVRRRFFRYLGRAVLGIHPYDTTDISP